MSKTKHKWMVVSFSTIAIAGVGCGAMDSDAPGQGSRSDGGIANEDALGYAEGVYAQFAASISEEIELTVTTARVGRLNDIRHTPFATMVEMPETWFEHEAFGTTIVSLRQNARQVAFDDWAPDNNANKFEDGGLAVDEGEYRMLHVRGHVKGQPLDHHALEFCWQEQGICRVTDPVFPFLDSFVENKLRLQTEGWQVQHELVAAPNPALLRAGTESEQCVIASDPTLQGYSYTWPAWHVWYKNIFGLTLVEKEMGEQKAGINCMIDNDRECHATPMGYSFASSCWTFLFGYRCQCDNVYGSGVTGRDYKEQAKAIAESKCTHRFAGSARASVEIKGEGASIDAVWDLAGSVDATGGAVFDACGWF